MDASNFAASCVACAFRKALALASASLLALRPVVAALVVAWMKGEAGLGRAGVRMPLTSWQEEAIEACVSDGVRCNTHRGRGTKPS